VRRIILEVIPEAEQGLSYRVPAFRLGGKTVAGFGARSTPAGDASIPPPALQGGRRSLPPGPVHISMCRIVGAVWCAASGPAKLICGRHERESRNQWATSILSSLRR
jgi:hypothetical protein